MTGHGWTGIGAVMVCATAVAGCAAQKTLQPVGGSRTDGIVELIYEQAAMERPVIDWQEAQVSALKRCQAWGYNNAERFGGQRTQCIQMSEYGCVRQSVIIPYQCIGTGNPL